MSRWTTSLWCLLLSLLSLSYLGSGLTIWWVYPRRGSIAGGTKVDIYGSGFSSDTYSTANLVFFGNVPCIVDWYTASSGHLQCITTAYPDAIEGETSEALQASIITGGEYYVSSGSSNRFTYRWEYTPQVRGIYPNSGSLGSIVEIAGYRFRGTIEQYERLYIGGYICDPIDPSTNKLYGLRWKWPLHLVKCRITEQQVGGWNATAVVTGDRGNSWNHSESLYPSHDGTLAMFELYPDIHEVSPHMGSSEGGTLLTIRGTGFGLIQDDVAVDVESVPCQVVSHSKTEIICWTGRPPPDSPAVATEGLTYPDTEEGLRFRGGRGANARLYWSISGQYLSNLHDSSKYPDNPDRYTIYPWFSTEDNAKRNNYGERFEAFFNPQESGQYTFFVASDDQSEVWFTQGNNISNVTKIASSPWPSGWHNYYYRDEQRSEMYNLTVGTDYLLVGELKESSGDDYIQVGVLQHETSLTYAQTQQVEREKQVIEVTTDGLYDIQTLNVVVNTSQVDSDFIPEFLVTWGERTSEPVSVLDLMENTDLLRETTLDLFNGVCQFGPMFGVSHYDNSLFGFEAGVGSTDTWGVWNGAEPEIVEQESFCGRHSLYIQESRALAFNLDEDDYDGFKTSDFPFLCLAYKLPSGHEMVISINIRDYGWRSISVKSTVQQFAFPLLAEFEDYSSSSIIDDDSWNFACADLERMLDENLETNEGDTTTIHRILGLGFYADPDPQLRGFYVDEVSFSSEERVFYHETYIPPARPNGIAIHDIITHVEIDENSHVFNLTVAMEIVPASCDYDVPLVNITLLNDSYPGVLEFDFSRSQNASVPLEGSYAIVYGEQTSSLLAHDATAEEIQSALQSLPGVGMVTVEHLTEPLSQDKLGRLFCPGRPFTIQFETAPGDFPLLQVDSSNLTGGGLEVSIREEVTGGLFLRPIPGHMLQTAETTPQVHVRVKGQLASCSGGTELFAEIEPEIWDSWCRFIYASTFTPQVDYIVPTTAVAGDLIQIYGSGLSTEDSGSLIFFGTISCDITFTNETVVECTLGEGSAGKKALYLHVLSGGVANTSRVELLFDIQMDSVVPNEGSTGGGTEIVITGTGFVSESNSIPNDDMTYALQYANAYITDSCSEWTNRVLIGSNECEITGSTHTEITCITPENTVMDTIHNVTVTVECVDNNSEQVSQTATDSYTYSSLLTPTVIDVNPTEGSGLGGDAITISGSGFSDTPEDNEVMLGDTECNIITSSSTTLTCTTPSHPRGTVSVSVSVKGKGRGEGDVQFTFVMEVDSISHCSGSIFGGQVLTLYGIGFGIDPSVVDIKLGNIPCEATIDINDTTINCVTGSSAETHTITNDAHHPDYGLGYQWTPDNLTVHVGDTVQWLWTGSNYATRRSVVQVDGPEDTEYNGNGFRSSESVTGSFSHSFTNPGIYYYIAGGFGHIGFRGSITVLSLETKSVAMSIAISSVQIPLDDLNIMCDDTSMTFDLYSYSTTKTPTFEIPVGTSCPVDTVPISTTGISTMPEDNVFTIGGKPCITPVHVSATTTYPDFTPSIALMYNNYHFDCIIPHLEPGTYRIVMHVAGRGWAHSVGDETIVIKPANRGDTAPLTGSLRGGLEILVYTRGLSPADITKTRVDIGNTPCPVQRITDGGEVTCITQAARDDGYSSLVEHSNALAYWSLQADYFEPDGLYIGSDGTSWFRSEGSLGTDANAAIVGAVIGRQDGISGNNITDQAANFNASYIEVPVSEELSSPAGFGYELWLNVPEGSEKYQIIVDSASITNDTSRGYLLVLNPCNELEFWLATGQSLSSFSDTIDCPAINQSQCSVPCNGYSVIEQPGETMGTLPAGVWHVIRTSQSDWSGWHQVAFGWEADNYEQADENCTDVNLCSGTQKLYVDSSLVNSSETTYLCSPDASIQIGGTSRLPVDITMASTEFQLGPFAGYLDEISIYSKPLEDSEVSRRHFYGSSESQPVWITVDGVDGVGTGVVPNVVYPELVPEFEQEMIVDWESVQDGDYTVENNTAIRVEWTGIHGIRQVSRSAYESCDLEAAYVRQWAPNKMGGSVTVWLEFGQTHYFIDSVVDNCIQGYRMKVQVGDVMVIEWRVTNYDDITIPEGAGLLFQWEGRIPHNVIEMASAVQPDCVFVGANAIEMGQVVREWHSTATTSGEVAVSGLSVGQHHFVCAVPGHCQRGMRFTVTVEAGSEGSTEDINPEVPYEHEIPWKIQYYDPLTIVEGELLTFSWEGFHSLHQVTEDVFDSCDLSTAPLHIWGDPSVDNSATIYVTPGTYYFICAVSGHCDAGMKIKVTVLPDDGVPIITSPLEAHCESMNRCYFTYSTENTPQLFSVEPDHSHAGTALTITGKGLALPSDMIGDQTENIIVWIDKAPCTNVTIVNNTEEQDTVECIITDYESDFYHVDVFVNNKGFASVHQTPLSPGPIRNITIPTNSLSPYPIFFLAATASGIVPVSGSLAGGTHVQITGTSFSQISERISVTIGNTPCVITSSSYSEITCVTGSSSSAASYDLNIQVNGFPVSTSLQYSYTSSATPVITAVTENSNLIGGSEIQITGERFGTDASLLQVQIVPIGNEFDFASESSENACSITDFTDTSISCTVPAEAAGAYSILVHVRGLGLAEGEATASYALEINNFSPGLSGNGGGVIVNISGNGFPSISQASDIDISSDQESDTEITICEAQCEIIESSVTGMTCTLGPNNIPSPFDTSTSCNISITYNDLYALSSDEFQFAHALTPDLASISPTVGGTAGGTIITITGSGFLPPGISDPSLLTEGDIMVTIDGAVCEWYGRTTLPSDTSIECRTTDHKTTLKAEMKVFIQGKGYAFHSQGPVLYEYIDRWSSVYTWGGGPLPQEGESVYIKAGQTVILDTSTPILNLILIEGALLFDDSQDVHLQAKYIFINYGKLQVGTEEEPFQHNAVITLHGNVIDPEIPIYGAKVLGIRQGELDLHGRPRNITWTRLSDTAIATDTILHVQDRVDWVAGDKIVIAPTGKEGNETEDREIASVSGDGYWITLTEPLNFTHHGVTEVYEDGQYIDIRAEVGLLSHNVVVEGSRLEDPTGFEGLGADQYGSQIFIHRMGPHPTPIRIEHTEVRYGGQAFRLGRYAIHFHLSGTMQGSYIRHCAIHHSNNRAITAHGVHDLLIEGNVAYDIKGHTYFVEDGIETNNTYLNNLGVLTRSSSSLLNTDQIPATFWITNPQNIFIGNAAAASRAFGFWYDLDNNPSGASYTTSVCPNRMPFGIFRDNVAHTCSEFGLRIWETYQPFVDGCSEGERDIATLYDFTSYANGIHGLELSVVGHVRLVGFKVADNVDNGIEIQETLGWWGGPMIQDSLIISHTSLNTGIPQTGGIKTPNTPFLTVSNVTFVNFDLPTTSCLRACSQCKVFQGGFQVWFEKLKFLGGSEEHKMFFQWEHEVLYRDLDGSLTGQSSPGWVLPDSGLLPPQYCTNSVPEFSLNAAFGGSRCTDDVYFLRMAWNAAQPHSTLNGVDVNVTNEFGGSIVPWRHYRLTHLDGYMFVMPSGYNHTLSWLLPQEHLVDTTFYVAGMYGLGQDDFVRITHEFVMLPDHINVGGNYEPTEHGDVPLNDDAHLSWHINNETNLGTYLISGGNTSDYHNRHWDYTYEPCPRSGCPPPGFDGGDYEGFQRRWSDNDSWPSNQPPQEGDEVIISSRWRMLLDVTPPTLGNVYILGELMVEDTRDYNFTANLVLVHGPNGRLIIGTEDAPFTHSIIITLNGRRSDTNLALTNSLSLGSKAIGVFGNVSIHGVPKTRTWTRLGTSAHADDNQITLEGNDYPNWLEGEEIVIAPMGWDPEEAEIRTIVEYDSGTGVITLNEPLEFDHLIQGFLQPSDLDQGQEGEEVVQASSSDYWWGDGGYLAPEVGLLTHNIVIQGGEHPEEPLEDHHYGCRLLVGEYTTSPFTYSGHLWMDSVEFRYCGQGGYFSPRDPRYTIAFRDSYDGAAGSYIRRCSIHHGYNTAIGIHTTNGVEVSNNVIWRTTDSSVKVGGNSNEIRDNLAMMTSTIQPNRPKDSHAVDFPATYDVDRGNVVRGNAAAGSTRLAFRFAGESCLEGYQSPTYDQADFWDNTAHTGLIGLNVLGLPEQCTAVGGFTSVYQWNYAVFSSIASSLIATHMKIGIGKVGLNLNVFGPNPVAHLLGRKSVTISDSLIVGSLPDVACETSAPDYRSTVSFAANDHKLGIMMSSFNQRRSKMDGTGAWHLMKGYPVIDGVVYANNLTFARFFETSCNYGTYAIGNNPLSPDAVHPMHMADTAKFNVEKSSLAFFYEPDVTWINQEDCIDMDCDGPKHALVRDTDGRFIGSYPSEGSVVPFAELRFMNYRERIPESWRANNGLGVVRAATENLVNYTGVARGHPDDLLSPYGSCVWVEEWQAYCCRNLQHHMLVIESMDADTETRRLSPLALNGGDTGAGHYTDLLNGPMDHGWCTYYTCLKRLSTFFSIVAMGTDYCIWMTGSLPGGLRFHLLNADRNDAIRLCIWYKNPQRKDIYKNGIYIEAENVEFIEGTQGGVQQLNGRQYIPTRDTFSGANYFDRESQILYLIVKGSVPIEIRTPPVVQVSLDLAVTIDDFFNLGELINNLAFVLRIDPSTIRVVNIIAEDEQSGRRRRNLLAVSNHTTITLEFGEPPAQNVSTPETPTVAEEVAMSREANNSVDTGDNIYTETSSDAANPLNTDPPESVEDFAQEFNMSVTEYVQGIEQYQAVAEAVEEANALGEQVVNLVLTGELDLENVTVIGISVVPAVVPAAPSVPVIPPVYENVTTEDNVTLAPVEEIPTEPPITAEPGEGEQEVIVYTIPAEMRVTMEPQEETGHLVHVAVAVYDANGDKVPNLGLVNPWMCEATLVHNYGDSDNAPELSGDVSVPFEKGEAVFTRLRVDRPAEKLTLVFRTNPTRFQTQTAAEFTVIAPPSNTAREIGIMVVLEGDVGLLPDEDLVESIRLGLSAQLDVDISRIDEVTVTVSDTTLAIEFDILDKQPTDPPDVLTLNETVFLLQQLVESQSLVIYIDEQPFIAVPGSFTHPEQPEPTKETSPSVDYSPIIIATGSAVGGVILSLCLVAVCCCCVKKKDTKDTTSSRGSEVPLHPVVKVNPMGDLYSDSDSDNDIQLERTTPFQSSSRLSTTTPTLPGSPDDFFDAGEETEETSIGASSINGTDCWDSSAQLPPSQLPPSQLPPSQLAPLYTHHGNFYSQQPTTLAAIANPRHVPPQPHLTVPTVFVAPAYGQRSKREHMWAAKR